MYYLFFFFFNDTATTEIYTLSLHDALPISEDRYRIYGATLTTCDKCEKPDWRVGIGTGTLNLGGYATGRNIVLELREKPVFWFPYAFFPAKTDRETGFLFPSYSSSRSEEHTSELQSH